jgi:hypothetical protein
MVRAAAIAPGPIASSQQVIGHGLEVVRSVGGESLVTRTRPAIRVDAPDLARDAVPSGLAAPYECWLPSEPNGSLRGRLGAGAESTDEGVEDDVDLFSGRGRVG